MSELLKLQIGTQRTAERNTICHPTDISTRLPRSVTGSSPHGQSFKFHPRGLRGRYLTSFARSTKASDIMMVPQIDEELMSSLRF